MLECDLKTDAGTQVSVLVNHWPSRLVGEAAGVRLTAAHYARSLLASKTRYSLQEMWDVGSKEIVVPPREDLERRASVPVIVMGDFNDEVFDASLEALGSTNDLNAVKEDFALRARTRKEQFRSYSKARPLLYNPYWTLIGRQGSYYRSPRWRGYDQIMVGWGALSENSRPRLILDSANVFIGARSDLSRRANHRTDQQKRQAHRL